MRNLSWDGVRADEIEDPPAPLQIFTRLGLLLMIALAFGLVVELLVRLPQH